MKLPIASPRPNAEENLSLHLYSKILETHLKVARMCFTCNHGWPGVLSDLEVCSEHLSHYLIETWNAGLWSPLLHVTSERRRQPHGCRHEYSPVIGCWWNPQQEVVRCSQSPSQHTASVTMLQHWVTVRALAHSFILGLLLTLKEL